jgi:hypothetical protein
MSKIKLTGDTSGYVEISAPNVAANNTLELGSGTKILTNLDNVFTGVTTYSGNIDLNANLDLDDNNKILLGTGDDLQIYHNGSESIILDAGTGQLNIRTDLLRVNNTNDNETLATFANNGAVSLYYDNSKKLETTTTGATVTGTLVSGSVTSELDLTAISSSISDTAVDVFVYDTRKDSDGGAWRKRTQHTSWYNETLNTATRGSRREFPAVAVIVAENDTLTIYDGDDPDLPMWMVFNAGNANGNNMIGRTNESTTCTSMLNGLLCVGRDHFGFHMINFIADRARFKENGYDTPYTLPIGTNRNGGNSWLGVNVDGNDLVNDLVNDVAMTVLPNAPIDDATGLPIPTIAVATAGGVSVIKDNGNVWDDTSSSGVTAGVASVEFVNDTLYYGRGGAGGNLYVKTSIGSVSANFSASHYYRYQAGGYGEVSGVYLKTNDDITVTKNKNDVALFGDTSLVLLEDKTTSSLVAYATTSYNTGWMLGDIKGAFLSDTDTTNVSADTLNSGNAFDGTFASSTGWTADSDWSISGGVATCNGNNSGRFLYPTTDRWSYNRSVVVEVTVTAYTSGTLAVSYGTGAATSGTNMTATGTYRFVNVTTGNEVIYFRSDSFVGSIDNVKIYYTEEDRSVNNNGLILYGTITKSAVATGAELVGYSGFTGSNYMTYNASNMNFGTGDFSVSVWCIPSTDQSNEFILELDNASSGSNRFYFLTTNTTTKRLYLPWDSDIAGSELTTGEWNHIVVGRKSGYGFVYVNNRWISDGNKAWTVDLQGNGNGTISNYSGGVTNDYAWSGSLALLRISGSAPSAEQVSKMYHDEKVLFQENAKATLYGSSDAVTALAYDEDTELLHVGTSSGRSDFQGLRRINNTTTAVTTAISASDDLIAEQ